jgi:hypothetical protein
MHTHTHARQTARTDVALLAVVSIDADSLADPADLAVGTVVDVLSAVVIVKLADLAVVVRQAATAWMQFRAIPLHRCVSER